VRGHGVGSPVRGRGVYTPDILCAGSWSRLPCAGSWNLYSILLIPVRGHGVCSLVNRETLLELRSDLRSDAHPATTIDFSGI